MNRRRAILALATSALLSLGLYSGVFSQADVNGDGIVNILDLSVIGSCLGADPAVVPQCENADADGNGIIDLDDIVFVSELFDVEAETGGAPPDLRAFIWHDRNVSASSLPANAANPFRGRTTPLIYTATGAANRRYYTRSQDLANLTDPRLQSLFWEGDTPSDGYTDLVDPFPEELNSLWDDDFYFTAPKDFRFAITPPPNAPNQKFGGDYSGEAACVNDTLANRHPEDWNYPEGVHPPGSGATTGLPRCNPALGCPGVPGDPVVHDPSIPHSPPRPTGAPPSNSVLMRQIDGTDKQAGCRPFSNLRVAGGTGERPMRPAPDRSNLFTPIDPAVAQGLAFPPTPATVYERHVDIVTGRPLQARGPGFNHGSCAGEAAVGAAVVRPNASANRDPKSYGSTTPAGIGREAACLKPGGAPGGLSQNGFTVARNDIGEVRFVRVDAKGVLVPGPGSTFVSDGVDTHPTSVVPIDCETPDAFPDCEPMRYEVGLNESSINGALFPAGWSPENALQHHSADQGAYACISKATPAFDRFDSLNFLDDLFASVPVVEVMSCLLAGEIGSGCSGFLDFISQDLQGISPTREAGLVPLNRDRNDGIITAQSRRPTTAGGGGIINRDTLFTGGSGSPFVDSIFSNTKFLPGPEDMLTLDSTLTNEQRALLGCGPFFGTRCDTASLSPNLLFGVTYCNLLGSGCAEGGGIDFLNMEAGAVMQSIVQGSGPTDPMYTNNPNHPEYAQWAAGGVNFSGTPFAPDGIWLTTSGLPQPGTIEFIGEPFCRRFNGIGGEEILLPGCRGISAVLNRETARIDGEVVFRFDDGYDADVDGCVLGSTIDGVPVRGIYPDGSAVDLAKCNESTHKTGGYYVWPCDPNTGVCETDANHTKLTPDLIDWDKRSTSFAEMTRSGAGTLWHPYAGCFADPKQALAGATCIQVPQEDIDEIKANDPVLASRLAWGQTGGKFAGDAPRNFEKAFFIPSGQLDIGGSIVDGFNIQSQIFRSTMAAVSWNLTQFLVATSCDKNEDDVRTTKDCFDPSNQFAVGKCSYATPQLCSNVEWFLGLTLPPSTAGSSVPGTCIPLMIAEQGENTLVFAGTAAEGTAIEVEVDGVAVVVTTSAGQSSAEVAEAVAAAINSDATLQGTNTTAEVSRSSVTINTTLGGAAINQTETMAVAIPSVHTWGLALVALLLLVAALLGIRDLKSIG